ncbi:fungal-specific transcription factor domain-containing protein [Rhexocercosporidium sp. MPI-PUGE-AT-0058]|nr:fungal-specific transcription factor domain-containing protein [Rhexocercosporidium sp. MPI-PUGE-AT-0058]
MPAEKLQSNVRTRQRRTRAVTCCLECRRRKIKCDKSNPCSQCRAFSQPCIFPESPKLPLSKSRAKSRSKETLSSAESAFGSDQNVEADIVQYGENETNFGEYDHHTEDSEVDSSLQIGKMCISERVGGLFRPYLLTALSKINEASFNRRRYSSQPGTLSSVSCAWHKPNSLCPSSSFLFLGHETDKGMYQLTRPQAELLYCQYFDAVDALAHIFHKPTFYSLDQFFNVIQAGDRARSTDAAIVSCVCFAAAVSLENLQVQTHFQFGKQMLVDMLMKNAEKALHAAHFMTTSKIKVLQAFTVYLIPQCRGEISRSHSVLVGALVRLAQCINCHRAVTKAHSLQSHTQALLWYQILFLEIRTGEAQGPLPTERTDDLPLPLNFDDLGPFSTSSTLLTWTDSTFSIIRYECYEIHRFIFRGRVALERNEITISDLLHEVDMRKNEVTAKYDSILDGYVPIQQCAKTVMKLLLARCDGMTLTGQLHRFEDPSIQAQMKARLLNACLDVCESGALLEHSPSLAKWAWYSETYQQYHSAITLLMEIWHHPTLPQRDRICSMIDHVFGVQYGWAVEDRVIDILRLLMRSLEAYLDLRKVRKRDITPPITSSLDSQSVPQVSGWMVDNLVASWQDIPIMSEDWNWAYGTTDDLWQTSMVAPGDVPAMSL